MTSVEVVAVGDELLQGEVVDTNTSRLARLLVPAGAQLTRATLVGDQVADISAAVAAAVARRPDAVVVSGGLGPTSDDRTRDALAALAGVPLARQPDLEADLASSWYARSGRRLQEPARRQADIPRGARVLDNPAGSAPGFVVHVDRVAVYALPGVPEELAAMAERHLVPELTDDAHAYVVRTLHVVGLGESELAVRLAALEVDLPPGVGIAYLPAPNLVRVKLSARGPSARPLLEPYVQRARALLGTAVAGQDDEPAEASVHRLLRAAGHTVAVAESLTAGALGEALTRVPGASATFRGGLVAYSTDLKTRLLGVDPALLRARGAVDPEVAAQMALGVRHRLGASYGVATTGVAGPEPQDGVPVGTVHLAVAGPAAAAGHVLQLRGTRDQIRQAVVVGALQALLEALLEAGPDPLTDSRDETR